MKETDPLLDLQGSDRKILQIAYQDFINYAKFIWKLDSVEIRTDYLAERITQISNKQSKEFSAFLTVWVGIWLKKWKERAKLFFENQNQQRPNSNKKITVQQESLKERLKGKHEIIATIIYTLIRNGEICCTEILAENILRKELEQKPSLQINNKEEMLQILGRTLQRARRTAQFVGPLIYVRIDKGYYCATKN